MREEMAELQDMATSLATPAVSAVAPAPSHNNADGRASDVSEPAGSETVIDKAATFVAVMPALIATDEGTILANFETFTQGVQAPPTSRPWPCSLPLRRRLNAQGLPHWVGHEAGSSRDCHSNATSTEVG
jgi:hypothetical protein